MEKETIQKTNNNEAVEAQNEEVQAKSAAAENVVSDVVETEPKTDKGSKEAKTEVAAKTEEAKVESEAPKVEAKAEEVAAVKTETEAPAESAPEEPEEEMLIVTNDLKESFEDAISATVVTLKEHTLVKGTVVQIDRDEVLLDIGYKSEGVIPIKELSLKKDIDPNTEVELGQTLEAVVMQVEDADGRLILSKKRAQYERAWKDIEDAKENGGVIAGTVIEVVKGGLIIDVGLRAFCPASLIDTRKIRDLSPYMGQVLECKILEVDKLRNNVVLSRKAFVEENEKDNKSSFLSDIKVGDLLQGKISSVVAFGAFVDLGGVDGLVHVSELSWQHIDHPSSVVKVGDEVNVKVLEVDNDRDRISLSIKQTQGDPWQTFANSHAIGELVYAKIVKIVPFGVFFEVEDGIEGLVHISELTDAHVDTPEQVVEAGEQHWLKITDLDLERRRISLSLKQAAEGGVVAKKYEHLYGEHAYDAEGNYIGDENEAVSDDDGDLVDSPEEADATEATSETEAVEAETATEEVATEAPAGE
jgi:small subunit ribosomal protein S1